MIRRMAELTGAKGYLVPQVIGDVVLRSGNVLRLDTVKALLQLPHFIYVGFHQWALIILVDLPDDKLRITPGDELLDSEVCRDPETGKQPLVLRSVVGGNLPGKVHLDHILEVLSGGRDEQYASTGAL